MRFDINRSFVIVLGRHASGNGIYIAQHFAATIEEAVLLVATGEISDPLNVFEFNPVEGWSRDISADVAQIVLDNHGVRRTSRNFMEDHLGVLKVDEVQRSD
jgi:hypothetical protein